MDVLVLPKIPKNHKKSDGTGHINSSEKLNTTREKIGPKCTHGRKKKYKFCCARIDSFEDRFYTIILLLLNNL